MRNILYYESFYFHCNDDCNKDLKQKMYSKNITVLLRRKFWLVDFTFKTNRLKKKQMLIWYIWDSKNKLGCCVKHEWKQNAMKGTAFKNV